jgi:hypothetical protein
MPKHVSSSTTLWYFLQVAMVPGMIGEGSALLLLVGDAAKEALIETTEEGRMDEPDILDTGALPVRTHTAKSRGIQYLEPKN